LHQLFQLNHKCSFFGFPLGMAIFDTMKHIRPDVSTVCIGLAARYGTYISVE